MIRYCKHCGLLIEDETLKVCTKCGTPLDSPKAKKKRWFSMIIMLILIIIASFGLYARFSVNYYHVQGFVVASINDNENNTYIIDGFVGNSENESYLAVTTKDAYSIGDYVTDENFIYKDFLQVDNPDGGYTNYDYFVQK